MARTKTTPVPEVGTQAPEFNLPSAQGGQLRLSMRTARGPVVAVFYRPWSEEDVEYFKALSAKEDEINLAAASVVGIGIAEPADARDFVRKSGIKSYVLYDYVRITTRQWGLLEKDKEHGEYARPAVFVVGPDHNVAHAWIGERPGVDEILARVSEITGLPKPAEEEGDGEEKPKKAARKADAGTEERKKLSPEEREKRRAERRAARETGETPGDGANKPEGKTADQGAGGEEKPEARPEPKKE